VLGLASLVVLVLLGGCGSESPTSPGDGGGGSAKHLSVFEIYLRPRAIMRPPVVDGLPNPQLTHYFLSAFFEGGVGEPRFDWSAVGSLGLGTIIPKAPGLRTDEAAVVVLSNEAPPLGFHDFTVTARDSLGGETSTLTQRFAVIENTWQKHDRATFPDPANPPANLVASPIFAPSPSGDEIFYIAAPNAVSVNLRRINAFTSLNGPAQSPGTAFVIPSDVNGSQALTAAEGSPAMSPIAMGQDDLLFCSEMDPDDNQRPDTSPPPFRLCLVQRPSGIIEQEAKVLTEDSTYVEAEVEKWYAFDYRHPRWDPTATGFPAHIAFLTDNVPLDSVRTLDVWTADLVDTNGDNQGDALENFNQLTHLGNVTGFAWHPDGQSLYLTGDSKVIRKVSAIDGSSLGSLSFSDEDSLLASPAYVSLFQRAGGPTLVAFQATSENRTHLYVYNEDEDMLTRVSPYPFPVGTQLHPSWHPEKMWLVYVCDYSVNAWSNALDPPPLINGNFEQQPRTRYPSVWVMKLED
jgi:hypothetical protein